MAGRTEEWMEENGLVSEPKDYGLIAAFIVAPVFVYIAMETWRWEVGPAILIGAILAGLCLAYHRFVEVRLWMRDPLNGKIRRTDSALIRHQMERQRNDFLRRAKQWENEND